MRAAVEEHGAVVLRAPTGAGKTTRVPPALLRRGGRVVVVEPRRVAARAAARRIAEERGTPLGGEVGYRIRFEQRASERTRLLVLTEGVLLRMLQEDPFLEGTAVVVFDEFHERSLASDLALAMVRRVQCEVRGDLAVVVMSATLDPGPVARFLGDAPLVESRGRLHPVRIEHAPPPAGTPLEHAVRGAVLRVLQEEPEGDVLVFLPGVGEIRRAARALRAAVALHDADCLELHGELPPERQDAALAPGGRRKVILATNVAETSVTVPGVRAVVDTGWERRPRFDPRRGMERLETVRISLQSAEQRAGRAGRTAPGRCVRLWSPSEEARFDTRRAPEIFRADLAGAALELHAWGESDLRAFPFFEAPPAAALATAEELLQRLGALGDGRLTDTGRRMARLPVPPRLARLLVEADGVGHPRRLALAAAALAARSPFVPLGRGEAIDHAGPSDVLDLVEALEAFELGGRLDGGVRPLRRGAARQALRARDQLLRWMGTRRIAHPSGADEAVLVATFAAYADRLARRRRKGSDRAVMVGGRGVWLAPSSAVRRAEFFVAVDVDAGARGERSEARVRQASAVDPSWLPAERVRTVEAIAFDPTTESVVGTRRRLFDDLALDEVLVRTPRGAEVERVLVEAASRDLDAALPLDDPDIQAYRARVACLRAWRPALGLPLLDDDALRDVLPALATDRRSFAELRRAPLLDHLRGRLSWAEQQTLDREAPERIAVPSGSRIRLRYEEGRPPVLAVRIQEVFGLVETPTVAAGRVKVLVHLLAPNRRPQQITDDLPSFWANTYPEVRRELRRRYPKHAWPEHPTTADAERRPRPRR